MSHIFSDENNECSPLSKGYVTQVIVFDKNTTVSLSEMDVTHILGFSLAFRNGVSHTFSDSRKDVTHILGFKKVHV